MRNVIFENKPFRDEMQRFVLRSIMGGVCGIADKHGIDRNKAMGYMGAMIKSLSKTTDFAKIQVK